MKSNAATVASPSNNHDGAVMAPRERGGYHADAADSRPIATGARAGYPEHQQGGRMIGKYLLAFACLAALAAPARAQKAGDLGAGVALGSPTAVTGKMWIDGTQAVDAGLGWNSELTVYADYLWHAWDVMPQPSQGKLPLYLGLGGQVRTFRDAEFGIRTVAGAAYWLPNHPIELFAEIVPIFRLTRYTGVGVDGAVGLRVYFR
jgi:hypothetical protein